MQANNTMFVADEKRKAWQCGTVLDHRSLLDILTQLRDQGATTNAELQRLLNLPSSRVSDIFKGARQIKVDEMKALVEHFGLERQIPVPSAEMLEPILDAMLPLAPSGRMTPQSRRALAEALAHGLQSLAGSNASFPSPDALDVAARAAAIRFRELGSATLQS